MNRSGKMILITGATGQQGGAVTRHLIKNGWTVRCLVRDPNKPKAIALAKAGATLVEGNLNDKESLMRALKGCYGLFSVQPSIGGADVETKEGNTLSDAAKTAGIKHTVYTSVASADKRTGIPFFDSKLKIEQHIQSIGLPATIIRPAFFMENFETYFPPKEKQGTWTLSMPLLKNRPLQLIALDDIGAFTALLFDHPEESLGKIFELAGDELTPEQIVTNWSRISGKKVQYEEIPIDQFRRVNKDYATMFDWFNKHGYTVDIKSLKSKLPQLHRFDRWLSNKHGALTAASHR